MINPPNQTDDGTSNYEMSKDPAARHMVDADGLEVIDEAQAMKRRTEKAIK